ncbi:hypothetical protein [Tenacibaculum finnmarkense]|uniref:hypothetical protein n=1 Tax=Tenacibaculum finnmarkense TaxID=2781243 RepID=UPI001E365DE7|nr:hypothetical protein [Tenacibaculum finnmarkense]MCD8411917.1 hypothetical protein [Tenacibaculum finnmarkense genomovar ulcerans]
MKKFLLKIIVFSVIPIFIILLLLFVMDKYHQYLPSKMYYSNEFNKAFNENDIALIALGNSKLLASIDKEKLDKQTGLKSAILGYSSANISISKLILESYLNKAEQKPKLVLLEVSWFTFNKKRTHFHGISGDLFIKDYRLWKNYFDYYPEINSKIASSTYKNLIKFFKKEKKYTYYNDEFIKNSPFFKEYQFKIEDFEVVFPNHIAGVNQLLLKDFKSIINMCKEYNIELILYSAPEDEQYSKMQKDNKEVKDIFYEVATNNLNVFYLDYTLGGSFWDKKYEMWLLNSHHINENDLFTEVLIHDIKSIQKKLKF